MSDCDLTIRTRAGARVTWSNLKAGLNRRAGVQSRFKIVTNAGGERDLLRYHDDFDCLRRLFMSYDSKRNHGCPLHIVRLRQPESSTSRIRDIFPYLGHARAHDKLHTARYARA